jgi:hypothetical protein
VAEVRDPEVVRREIALERQQLAEAVDRLRSETTRTKRRIGSRLKFAPAAVAAGIVLVAGVPRLVRYGVRRLRR